MKISNTKGYHADRLKILVYGESGSGKTRLASTCPGRTLVISSEAGLLSLNDFDIDVIDISVDDNGEVIPKEKRINRLSEVYSYLLTEDARKIYSWVYIDSLTEISQNLIEMLQKEFPDRKDSLVLYGENSKRLRSLIKSFRDLSYYNIVMTALPLVGKDQDGYIMTRPQVVGSLSDKLPSMFDEVFFLTNDGSKRILITEKQDRIIAKDRSGKLESLEDADLAKIYNKIQKTETPTSKEVEPPKGGTKSPIKTVPQGTKKE